MQSNSVMTLSNSIIGVSILAMPFCFQQCGIILSLMILFFTSIISRLACHFLLKSAIISRCRSFEFLAFHIFGPAGKTVIELSIVGFLMGSCVAFFVVVGDLGPAIVKSVLNLEMSVQALRPALLIGVAVFIILPLGMVRDIDSLSSICTISIGFYIILVLKIIVEATPPIFASTWADKVNFWRPAGILQCLPIFSSALSCQTQLFEIFGGHLNGPLDKINGAIKSSVNMCTAVYMGVGLFGYIAFCSQPLTGNALMSFPASLSGDIIKLGFVVSVALSFPLVIFPCRASLYSFLFHQTHSPHYELLTRDSGGSSQNVLTLLIVTISLILALLVPSIELVLGLLGSTIGVILCYILPSVFFTRLLKKNTNERLLAQVVIIVGVFIMVLGTYVNLFAAEEALSGQEKDPVLNINISPDKELLPEMKLALEEPNKQVNQPFPNELEKLNLENIRIADTKKDTDQIKVGNIKKVSEQVKLVDDKQGADSVQTDTKKDAAPIKSEDFMKETRREPLEPVAPVDVKKVVVEIEQPKVDLKKSDVSLNANQVKPEVVKEVPAVEKTINVAEDFAKAQKVAEKQVEAPVEDKAPIEPLKVEKPEIPISKARKIMKKINLSPHQNLSLPIRENVVKNVNPEGNLRPEIMSKLKETVPIPIALQKNINVFNVSPSQNVEPVKKAPDNSDKVINRELLDNRNKNDPLDRERRDVQTTAKKVPDTEHIVQEIDHENDREPAKLAVRSLQPADRDDSKAFSDSERILDDKLTLAQSQKSVDVVYEEGKIGTDVNVDKTIVLVSEIVNAIVGGTSDGNEANVDGNKQTGAALDNALGIDQIPHQAETKAVKVDQPDSRKIKASSKPELLQEDLSKDGTLKEVLKNTKLVNVKGEESCPKNSSVEKAVDNALNNANNASNSSNNAIPVNESGQVDARLNIQGSGRLSNPDNLLQGFETADVQIRTAFQDVAKPLKRDLKSVEMTGKNERPVLDSTFRELRNLDSESSKKIEFKDDR